VRWILLTSIGCVAALAVWASDGPSSEGRSLERQGEQAGAKSDRAPLEIELPKPAFKGTPTHVPPGTRLEKPRKGPRVMPDVPRGLKNVARGRPVSASDDEPIVGTVKLVTDGDKDAKEGSYVELGPGLQHVRIDLGKPHELFAVVVWHYHASARVYHDVIVQTADDEDFITNVRTLYSNDHDNSAGLGIGEDNGYWDTYEGRLISCDAVRGRYVRLFSNGSTADEMNHYTEVEVFGRPVQ
jgi:hypothetical protein